MTVAPRIPTASSKLSLPSKPGTTSPWANAGRAPAWASNISTERDHDHADKAGDHRLELRNHVPAGPGCRTPPLRSGVAEGNSGEPEQKVDADGGADELREIGRHGDRFRLDPEEER